jgi:DNA polymerase elongation subunit (family B)
MGDVLLSVSNSHAYFQEAGPKRLDQDLGHHPWFWAIPRQGEDAEAVQARIAKAVEAATSGSGPLDLDESPTLAKVRSVGDVDQVTSFVDFDRTRAAFPVYAKRSWFVPEISDELFHNHDVYTAEHDIPYQQRACVDLAAQGKGWMFDTGGQRKTLKVLCYDIETTQFRGRKEQVPIDMIGWSAFDLTYEASKDLDAEDFNFDIVETPPGWEEQEVEQTVARTWDEEVDHLLGFIRRVPTYDVITGHNILGFDNIQIHERIQTILERGRKDQNLNAGHRKTFEEFLASWTQKDRTFNFGSSQDVVHFHPTSLDTYHAARKFYFFLDDFTLKGLAPFLGVNVPDRVYLSPQEMKLDDRTALYNKHDIQEQLGVSMVLIAQALPLAFTTGWSLEELLTGGNTKMWDHVAAIRCAREKKLLPATCRAQSVATTVLKKVGQRPTKQTITEAARAVHPEDRASQYNKEFLRVAKYGDEMPGWMETPEAIVNPNAVAGVNGDGDEAGEDEETLSYAIAGGMTIHPQKVGSHFIPWWHVVAADVGAMYPTILRARNLGADTVRLAARDEEPDDWVLLYRLPPGFEEDSRFVTRRPGPEDAFVAEDEGVFVGVKIRNQQGAVPRAMGGIMKIATKIKKELAELQGRDDATKAEAQRKKHQYASIKAARNAGTHGIMVAVNVSCRQFNLWAGANITTLGQRILNDSLSILENHGARVVYGDTDGLYIGCGKSGKNLMDVSEALGIDFDPREENWIIHPDRAVAAIDECNEMWRKKLNYPEFELEAEHHAGMVFVVHKNYLIFDVKGGRLVMTTKGNNFRGSDKAPVAQKLLAQIMQQALTECIEWADEETARQAMQAAIKRATRDVLKDFDASTVALEDLTLRQLVKPVRQYKGNPDGSHSIWQKRTAALEKAIGEKITAPRKFKFVVTKNPLPGIEKPSKTGIKPLDYMYPLDQLKDVSEIDLDWYRDMMEKYVRGAFGFPDLELHTQKGLDTWM